MELITLSAPSAGKVPTPTSPPWIKNSFPAASAPIDVLLGGALSPSPEKTPEDRVKLAIVASVKIEVRIVKIFSKIFHKFKSESNFTN